MTFDATWKSIEERVFQEDEGEISIRKNVGREMASRQVVRLCKMGQAQALAEKVEYVIGQMVSKKLDHVHHYLLDMEKDGSSESTLEFLSYFRDFWIQFCMQMQSLRDIFLYLERSHLIKQSH